MQCSAALGTYLLLAAVNCDNLISDIMISCDGTDLIPGLRIPRQATGNGVINGCILPRQPMGGIFELNSCIGNSCDVSPGRIVPEGSYLAFKCNYGYTLMGNDVSFCRANKWKPLPSCARTCPALRSDSVDFDCRYNGEIVSCESAIVPGTTATLGCKDWYDIPLAYRPGFRKLICLSEGVWDRTISSRVPGYCPALSFEDVDALCRFGKETVSCDHLTAPETTATMGCKDLYEILPSSCDPANREITCLDGDVWSTVFQCVLECGVAVTDPWLSMIVSVARGHL